MSTILFEFSSVEDETVALINKFNKIDANGDGYIIFSEIKKAYEGKLQDFEVNCNSNID